MRRSIAVLGLSVLLLAVSAVSLVSARSQFAVICNINDAITSGTHGNTAQTGTGGYTFTIPASIQAGTTYNVGVAGTKAFTGFLMYAADSTGTHIGSWATTGTSQNDAGNCANYGLNYPTNSLIQHNSASNKGTSATWAWTAPTTMSGNSVTFAVLVMNSSPTVFWRLTSNAVAVAAAPTTTPAPTIPGQTTTTTRATTTTTTTTTTLPPVTLPTGTNYMGTFTEPRGVMAVGWTVDQAAGTFQWTLTAKTTGWVSFGICQGMYMTNNCDYVVGWVVDATGVGVIYDVYSTSYQLPMYDTQNGGTNDFTLVSSSQANGITTMVVSRKLVTADTMNDNPMTADLTYAQWGWGPSDGTPASGSAAPTYTIHTVPGAQSFQANFLTGQTLTTAAPASTPMPAYTGCQNVGPVNGTVKAPKEGMVLAYSLDTASCVFTWSITAPAMPAGGWMSVGYCPGTTMAGCDYVMAWFDAAGAPQVADTTCMGNTYPVYDTDNGGIGNFEVIPGASSVATKTITLKRPFYTGDPNDITLTSVPVSVQFSYGAGAPPNGNTSGPVMDFGYHGAGGYDKVAVNFYTGAATTDTVANINAGAWVCIFVSIAIGAWGVIRWSRKAWKELRRQRMVAQFSAVNKDTRLDNVVVQNDATPEMKQEAQQRFSLFKGKRQPMLAPQVLNDNSRAVQLWRSKWQQLKDAEGNIYYFNEELYTTAWEIPPMPDYFAAANSQPAANPYALYPASSASNLNAEGGYSSGPGRAQPGWQQKAPPQAAQAARHQRSKSVNSQAMVAKEGSSGQRSPMLLLKSFWSWRLPGTASSMSDLMVFSIYVAANLLAFFALDNTTSGGMADNKNKLGYLAAGNMLIVALPATRNSILVWFLGFPFDRVIVFHRWIGRMAILIVLLHFAYYLNYWNQNNITANSQLAIDTNKYGVVAFVFMLLILATSFGWLRRNYFNAFFYSHFMFILAYAFTYLHIKTQFYPYLVALIAIYGLDRLIRFVLGLQVHQTVKMVPKDGDIIQVRFPKDCIGKALNRYKIGQYVFINFPQLSLFEWHPFTLSSSPREVTAEVHIRSLGDHTKMLMEHVKGKGASMKIRVDGPYGNHRFTYRRYPALVLVGGGIGITPIVAILRDVFNVGDFQNPNEFDASVIESIYVAWVVPSIDKYKWFKQEFEECWRKLSEGQHRLPSLNIWIYASRSSPAECQAIEQQGMGYGSGTQFMSGKPDFDAMMNVVRENHKNTAVSVFACGPQQLTGDVWDSSNQQKLSGHRFDFHHETFDW